MEKDALLAARKGAVCGMLPGRRSAALKLQHAVKTCYVCAAVCRDAFAADREKYLSRRRRRHRETTNN
jgi:YHS domain-containing protein